jgi:hypothetical protein
VPSGQATLIQRHLALADLDAGGQRQQHGAGVGASGIRHHAGGAQAGQGLRQHVQLAAQQGVLGFQGEGGGLPAVQALILLPQPGVLGAHGPEHMRFLHGIAHRAQRLRHHGVDGRQGIRERHAGALHQHGVCLADQHRPEGQCH